MTTTLSRLIRSALVATIWVYPVHAEEASEFLLFLSADDLERSGVSEPAIRQGDFTPTIDFLYTYNNERWRVLAEYYLTDDENELERFQVGYSLSPQHLLWIGRLHQPLSTWISQYHHGAYLQPSISRPSIENWEDENGVVPVHIAGLMLDGRRSIGSDRALRYTASAGIAPQFAEGELLPFDLLDPDDGSGKLATSISISYFPDYVGESNFGLMAAYSEIEALPDPLLGNTTKFDIRQQVVGVHVNLEGDLWGLLSAAYYVDNQSRGSTNVIDDWFMSGYIQAGRRFGADWGTYARLERTRNATSDFLQLVPRYVHQRELLGVRWDFAMRQALAMEVSYNRVSMDEFAELRLQWSAVIP